MIAEQSRTSSPKRRYALIAVQVAGSLAVLTWLVLHISWREALQVLLQARPAYLALTCLAYYVGVWLSCCKWRLTLQIERLSIPFPRLLHWYLIGSFANNFLPTAVGGDLGRGLYASRYTGQPGAIARSIFIERFTGLLAMLLLAWLGLIMLSGQVLLAWLLAAGGIVAGIGVGLLDRLNVSRLRGAQRVLTTWREYQRRPRVVALVLSISLAYHLLTGYTMWAALQAVHVDLPLLPVILAVAMTNVLGMVPVAVNGWGVREAAMIGLLLPFGASASYILAGALLTRMLFLLLPLLGMAPFVFERPRVLG